MPDRTAPAGPVELAVTLASDTLAPALARRLLSRIADQVPPGLFYDASVCLSELVTTAILVPHRAPSIAVAVSIDDRVLRAEVVGVAASVAGSRDGLAELLMSSLADRFGADLSSPPCLWFEFDLEAGDAPRPRVAAWD